MQREQLVQVEYFCRDAHTKIQEISTKEEANKICTEENMTTKDKKEGSIQVLDKAVEIREAGDKFLGGGLERNLLLERPRLPETKLTGSGAKIEIRALRFI